MGLMWFFLLAVLVPSNYVMSQIHPCFPCFSNPCLNQGTCLEAGNGYTCVCAPGHTGQHCEEDTVCCPNPCQNGGQCNPTGDGGYECICLPGFTGDDCETEIPSCDTKTCLNGGTCVETPDPICVCPPLFTGPCCEEKIHPCLSDPCPNNEICVNDEDVYKCENSSTHPDCEPNPCLNGGTCVWDCEGPVQCECPECTTGPICEADCEPNPCLNGGTCVWNCDGTVQCECPECTTGPICEAEYCNPPCQNGGICQLPHEECPLPEDKECCCCPPSYLPPDCKDPVPPGFGYDCGDRNPCNQFFINLEWFYWPHNDTTKFVQCDEIGRCFIMDCPEGEVWIPVLYTCGPASPARKLKKN